MYIRNLCFIMREDGNPEDYIITEAWLYMFLNLMLTALETNRLPSGLLIIFLLWFAFFLEISAPNSGQKDLVMVR